MVTKTAAARSCDECKYSGSWHYREDPVTHEMVSFRCPNYLSADLLAQAHKLTEEAHAQQVEAVKAIILDKARSLPEFSSNDMQDELDAADITGRKSVVGSAFTALSQCKNPAIEATGLYVPHIKQSVRAKVQTWRSRIYRQAAS